MTTSIIHGSLTNSISDYLSNLEIANVDLQNIANDNISKVNLGVLGPQDMLKLQNKMRDFSFRTSLLSKVTSVVTRNVNLDVLVFNSQFINK